MNQLVLTEAQTKDEHAQINYGICESNSYRSSIAGPRIL